jgi:hypothetical protein
MYLVVLTVISPPPLSSSLSIAVEFAIEFSIALYKACLSENFKRALEVEGTSSLNINNK